MAAVIDTIQAQWRAVRPDLDSSPIAVFGRLSRVSRAAEARMQATFAAHGIDRAAFDVLVTLRREGEPHRMCAKDLQDATLVTSAAVAQRVNKLEERGFVRREPNPHDARMTDIQLTPEGFAVVDGAMADHMATEERMLRDLDAGQREQLAALLATLMASIDQE